MDKKQFFESFISLLPDKSGQKLDSLYTIEKVFASIKSGLTDTKLYNEFEQIEKRILSHVWMFEQICNERISHTQDDIPVIGPLIVISVSGEIIFVNKAYCELSGLSPTEVHHHENLGTLYSQVYKGQDAEQARNSIGLLRSGKGYQQLELIMKHSDRKISWNSYGGVGESLEIRSGRELHDKNDQRKERARFFRGKTMNSTRLIGNLYQVGVHGFISKENMQELAWIQEFLSMFDFLWNHSEFFMETIDIPIKEEGGIRGRYNTVYAQFFKSSFDEQKQFQNIISLVHGDTLEKILKTRKFQNIPSIGIYKFHQYNKHPVADICWQCSGCPFEVFPGYKRTFSIGLLVKKIQKKNIFIRIFEYFFRK